MSASECQRVACYPQTQQSPCKTALRVAKCNLMCVNDHSAAHLQCSAFIVYRVGFLRLSPCFTMWQSKFMDKIKLNIAKFMFSHRVPHIVHNSHISIYIYSLLVFVFSVVIYRTHQRCAVAATFDDSTFAGCQSKGTEFTKSTRFIRVSRRVRLLSASDRLLAILCVRVWWSVARKLHGWAHVQS